MATKSQIKPKSPPPMAAATKVKVERNIRKLTQGDRQSFEVRMKRAGFQALDRSFATLREARAFVNQAKSAHLINANPTPNIHTVLIPQVVDEYSIYRVGIGSPLNTNEQRQLARIRHDLMEWSIGTTQVVRLQIYLRKLQTLPVSTAKLQKDGATVRTYSASSARKIFYQLRKILMWRAVARGYQFDNRPFDKKLAPAAWSEPRTRRLETGEEEKLLAAAGAYGPHGRVWRIFIELALETAMRSQEMLKSPWAQLNLGESSLFLDKSIVKTKIARAVPLSQRAVELLTEMKEITGEHHLIFPFWSTTAQLSQGFARIIKKAGIHDLRIHDLRHEATSRLFLNRSLTSIEIMQITGHTNHETLNRYANLRPSELAAKLNYTKKVLKARKEVENKKLPLYTPRIEVA